MLVPQLARVRIRTTGPPTPSILFQRVGVIRRLMLGVTLRRIADDEEEAEEADEGTEGDWWIDLTQAKHKTSRF